MDEGQTQIEVSDMKKGEINVMPASCGRDSCDSPDIWCEDDSVENDSHVALDQSDLDREWRRRHSEFHTIGYRDGLLTGKEQSAQAGFNMGFKQSALAGYKWGLVRGVTSALSYLPVHLKEEMLPKLETREKVQRFYESVQSVSTGDATKLFFEDIMHSKTDTSQYHAVANDEAGNTRGGVNCSQLTTFSRDLDLLLEELPNIKMVSAVVGECSEHVK
ncbi:hypothetical protein H6P81_007473 [Aristolochia fimbriata]|uniref:Essential protein Yae1 N-terminal domain-containing protein n=1 Tax=Aristolochia fimbriata TaxID=158543 RepID=A0AAV7F1L6_ARIFI|nr:hypothetical protein H6P81_007473 [Aristolochia fimbriata]